MGVNRAAWRACAYMSVVVFAVVCAALLMLAAAVPAFADMGPKPTVIVTVKGLPEGECYGTLLSQTDSTGPESAYESTGYKQLSEGGEEVWQAFDDYAKTDPDGFYFLQLTWDVASTGTLDWTYYPPETFKVALYFPETGVVVTSDVLQRYAFDSTYEIDLTGVDADALQADALSVSETGTQRNGGADEAKKEANVLPARETGTVAAALPGAALRLLLTVAIELAVAWVWGYRKKNQLLFVLLVNVATQLALNVALVAVGYRRGPMAADFALVKMEVVVFAVEAALFAWWLGGRDQRAQKGADQPASSGANQPASSDTGQPSHPRVRAALCAVVANAASLIVGLLI